MNQDFKVSTGLFTHPKTLLLVQAHKWEGVIGLMHLWAFAAKERIDGDLSGLSTETLEHIANWNGSPGALVASLSRIGFLDGIPGKYSIHNWLRWNEYASLAEWRIERARKGGKASAKKRATLHVVTPASLDPAADEGGA